MVTINGKTKTYGLIANPVEHTMSPLIHNMLAKHLDINMTYVPFCVEKGELENAIKGGKALSLGGFNVTVPYKVDVMKYLDSIDEDARRIGAVNTVHFKDGKAYGYNTDFIGFLMACKKKGITFSKKNICILGAGGSAKALSVMCANEKVASLTLVNRTLEKAEDIKKIIESFSAIQVEVLSYEQLYNKKNKKKFDICIQTTPVGMHPHIESTPLTESKFFEGIEHAIDIIYNPKETKFLKDAKKHGVNTMNGLGMLYYQAVKAFEIWNNCIVPEEVSVKVFSALEANIH